MTTSNPCDASQGWIKLHRQFLDSRVFNSSPATFKVCIYLMLSANHKPRIVRGVQIERGQCIRSLTMIADDCDLSRKAVRCALDNLEKFEFITTDAPFGAQQGHRISVCNYATYQDCETDRGIEGSNEGSNEVPQTRMKEGKNEKKQCEIAPSAEPPKPHTFKNWTEAEFRAECKSVLQSDAILSGSEIEAFMDYWTEPTPSGKLRLSTEKTWDTQRRMKTWRRNQEKFGRKSYTPPSSKPRVVDINEFNKRMMRQ